MSSHRKYKIIRDYAILAIKNNIFLSLHVFLKNILDQNIKLC